MYRIKHSKNYHKCKRIRKSRTPCALDFIVARKFTSAQPQAHNRNINQNHTTIKSICQGLAADQCECTRAHAKRALGISNWRVVTLCFAAFSFFCVAKPQVVFQAHLRPTCEIYIQPYNNHYHHQVAAAAAQFLAGPPARHSARACAKLRRGARKFCACATNWFCVWR